MFIYWQFIAFALARSLYDTADAKSQAFRDAALTAQQLGALYNFVAFAAALLLIPVVRRWGPRSTHAMCLTASGSAMLAIPFIDAASFNLLYFAMIGIGVGWAGMMGNTYVMLAGAIPPDRNGIYMGIFNLFIVIPMLIETLTMPLIYHPLLGGDPRNALYLGGLMMLAGALATLFVDAGRATPRRGVR